MSEALEIARLREAIGKVQHCEGILVSTESFDCTSHLHSLCPTIPHGTSTTAFDRSPARCNSPSTLCRAIGIPHPTGPHYVKQHLPILPKPTLPSPKLPYPHFNHTQGSRVAISYELLPSILTKATKPSPNHLQRQTYMACTCIRYCAPPTFWTPYHYCSPSSPCSPPSTLTQSQHPPPSPPHSLPNVTFPPVAALCIPFSAAINK